MNLLRREKDVFSGEKDLEKLYTIKNFLIYMGVADPEFSEDIFADMEWGISKSSGMLQLLRLVPEDVLYKTSHNGSIGGLWQEHHTQFAEFIHGNMDNSPGAILEIGGGNGILNAIYTEKYSNSEWIIVEPSSVKPVDLCKARYIRKMWGGENFACDHVPEVQCLIHSHVLEHLYDVENFMLQCELILHNGRKMFFSVPNLKETLRRKYTNALNFEHTYFISDDYIEELLRRHSFTIIAKQYFKEDHSIFYATEKCSVRKERGFIDYAVLYLQNKKLFMEFIESQQKLIKSLNARMSVMENSPVYLFGAHIFSQYLINFGLDVSRIWCVLDNDVKKQGKRLYGTDLFVKSPAILAEDSKPFIVLKVANYADEIKEDILNNINPNAVFWED